MIFQRTIKDSITISGVGLHTGAPVRMTLSPAPVDTGVMFISGGVTIPATYDNVVDTNHATTLGRGGVTVKTVEHLLAAIAGLNVDNVVVEVDGPEAPAMDGSAEGFVKAILGAGLKAQGSPRRYIKLVRPVTVSEGDKSASLIPSPVSRVTYRIDFDHPMLKDQCFSLDLDAASFVGELAFSRTFGFLHEVEMLRKAGLAKGGSLDNAVVIDGGMVLNTGGLRRPDEFVRHKILDAIGDISLAGMPIIGHLVADKSGHKLNHRLVTELIASPESWVLVEGSDERPAKAAPALTEAAR